MPKEVLYSKPYNPGNPADAYLSVVLCRYDGQLVTWVRNAHGGDSHGHYFDDTAEGMAEALEDYAERGVKAKP